MDEHWLNKLLEAAKTRPSLLQFGGRSYSRPFGEAVSDLKRGPDGARARRVAHARRVRGVSEARLTVWCFSLPYMLQFCPSYVDELLLAAANPTFMP